VPSSESPNTVSEIGAHISKISTIPKNWCTALGTMRSVDIGSYLTYGAMGFAALALGYGFYVIQIEQRRKGQARDGIIRMFQYFCGLAALLAVIALLAELGRHENYTKEEIDRQRQTISALRKEIGEKDEAIRQTNSALTQAERKNHDTSQQLQEVQTAHDWTLKKLSATNSSYELIKREMSANTESYGLLKKEFDAFHGRYARLSKDEERKKAKDPRAPHVIDLVGGRIQPLEATSLKFGETFRNEETGFALGISGIDSGLLRGVVTYPDGSQEPVMDPVGMTWNFSTDTRRYMATVDVDSEQKSFKVKFDFVRLNGP